MVFDILYGMAYLIRQGLRQCYVCKEIKPLNSENFHRAANKPGGYNYECRSCCNRPNAREKNWPRDIRRTIIAALGHKCAKCGLENDHDSFFDLDHIVAIRQGRGHRRYKLEEIDQYMLLCPNCHRLKTISENGFV